MRRFGIGRPPRLRYAGPRATSSAGTPRTWRRAGESDVRERVDADLRDLLASHWPEPLPDAVRERMNSILEKYGAQLLA